MLLDYIVDACDEEYQQADTSVVCNNCGHPVECTGNCKRCLDEVHFPSEHSSCKMEYDCINMLNYYVCSYSHKYCSEIEYALNEVESLKALKKFKVMSIGCGAAPDLMALEFFKTNNNLSAPIHYRGYDKNNLWQNAHEKIEKYVEDHDIDVDFRYEEVIKHFSKYYVNGINLLFLQYVISYFYNTNQIGNIHIFFDDLVDIVKNKDKQNDFIVIINDVNSYYRGRDHFEVLCQKLENNNYEFTAKKRYFDYNLKSEFQRYGKPHTSINNLHNIPSKIIGRYNPAIYCSSAQLIIQVKG